MSKNKRRKPKKFKPFPKFDKRPTEPYINKIPCNHCGKLIVEEDFRNERARLEYDIRGLCQLCQDKILNLGD
jgi:hypothetical protein